MSQSEINIGLVGHVDHGKTTLTKSLSGTWTDKHSEEIKRGISIRLGYADCEFRKCPKCDEPECYTTEKKCRCGTKTKNLRKISFVDAPGHETLMATMLSGAAMMDGAVLVIAANEDCPQPQTAEHLAALDILGVKNIVIAQNKVDLVDKEKALENYNQIKNFIKNSVAENAPIVPIAAHYNVNIDVLIETIERTIPTPERDTKTPARMCIARSFDINKPGAKADEIMGGVIGGSLIHGILKIDDEIELRPGVRKGKSKKYEKISTKIIGLNASGKKVKEVHPGGLVGIATTLDPSLTKSDNLVGNVIGPPGTLPEVHEKLKLKINLMERIVAKEEIVVNPLLKGENLMLSIGSALTLGIITNPKKGEFNLMLPVCAERGSRVAISRRFGPRWRLIGFGTIK